MGARLMYAKVIDRQLFYDKGGRVHPGLENEIMLPEEPGVAAAFLVLRGWSDDHGTCTESWKLVTPGGTALYESTAREIHLATPGHVEKLQDEVADLEVTYATDDYEVVFSLDGREVARTTFGVRVVERPSEEG